MVEFRDVVKKYASDGEALGVKDSTVDGIPLGAAASMSPVEVVTDPDAQAALSGAFAALNAGREGTGMPAGVVSAPVGTVYRDLAATNGAVVWVKASGSGNTGWRVVWGDTGWRAITTWDASGVVTGTPLAAGWKPRTGVAGGIWLRRITDVVHVRLGQVEAAAASTPDVLISLPVGFQGGAPVAGGGSRIGNGAVLGPGWTSDAHLGISTTSIGRGAGTTFPIGAIIEASGFIFLTDQTWPSTLPGTAA